MKRLFIPTVLALSSLAMVAQVPQMQSPLRTDAVDVSYRKVNQRVNSSYSPKASNQAKAPMAQFNIISDIGDGAYHTGLTNEFKSVAASVALGTMGGASYFRSYHWTQDESTTITAAWYEKTESGAQGEALEMEGNQAKYSILGSTYFPLLVGTANDGSSLTFDRGNSPYTTTQGAIFSNLFNHENTLSMFDPATWTADASYYTGYTVASRNVSFAPGYGVEKIAQVFSRTVSPMVVYGGNIAVIQKFNDPNQECFLNDSKLHIALCTCDLENYQLTNLTPIAMTSVGAEDLVFDDGWNGILEFSFTQEDQWGSEVLSPVVIPSGTYFAIVVSGFDSADLNLCLPIAPTGASLRTDGYLYHAVKGASNYIYPFSEDGATYPQMNALISLTADLPGAMWALPEMTAPVDGGTVSVEAESTTGEPMEVDYNLVYTSMPFESDLGLDDNYEFELPEWLTIEATQPIAGTVWSSSDGPGYGVWFSAQPLPQGEAGRVGTVYIVTRTGLKFGFNVLQGEVNPEDVPSVGLDSAEESVNNAYVSGDQLNLTYAVGYGVADVYNVAGVKVASYQLPEGGNYEASVSGLADGVYVVVFRGADAATVKFVK